MLPGFMPGATPSRHRFVTDFREYPTGTSVPFDFTEIVTDLTTSVANDAAMPGGRYFTATPGGGYAFYTFNPAGGSVTDGEITAILRSATTTTSDSSGIGWRTNTGFSSYELRLGSSAAPGSTLDMIKANVAFLSATAFTWSASTLYAFRVRFQGTNHKARVWQWGNAEPSTWLIDVTDSAYASGFVSLSTPGGGTAGRWTWFAFRAGSGTAPLPQG